MVVWHLARALAFAAQANGTSSSSNGQAAAQEVSDLEVSRLLESTTLKRTTAALGHMH